MADETPVVPVAEVPSAPAPAVETQPVANVPVAPPQVPVDDVVWATPTVVDEGKESDKPTEVANPVSNEQTVDAEKHPSLAQKIEDAEGQFEDAGKRLADEAVKHLHHLGVSLLHEHSVLVDLVRDCGPGGVVHHQEQIVDHQRG